MNPGVLVAGFSRCGTTMVMTMLEHGGFPVLGTYPYEDDRIFERPWLPDFVEEAKGRAVKLLEPIECQPPAAPYQVILMSRNPLTQAESHRRFLRLVAGIPVPRSYVAQLAKELPRLYGETRTLFKSWGARVLEIDFAAVIGAPNGTASRIADFLAVPLDVCAMAAAVIPRTPGLAPVLMEPALLEHFAPEVSQGHFGGRPHE